MFEFLKIIKTDDVAEGLAFSDNFNLGVALRNGCVYIFDPNGNLLNKVCRKSWMSDASYCCGRFGFVSWNGYVYITDESGKLIEEINVGHNYNDAITMTKNGFVACNTNCAFFDFNGNKKWDLSVGIGDIRNGPSYYNDYWYLANNVGKLLIVKDGDVINEINYNERAYDTAVCSKLLAVGTLHHLYLYELSDPANPKEIWNVEGFDVALQVAFSPNCEYIIVADNENKKLKIFNIEGDLIFEKKYGSKVYSVDWKNNRIAVGVDTNLFIYHIPPIVRCFGWFSNGCSRWGS